MSDARDSCVPAATSVSITDLRSVSPRTTAQLACLNFKVPLPIRQQFKMYAARHNMTMTELLLRLLDDCLSSDTTKDSCAEIKK